ncbi:unnamed protein product [Clonostachys byssicola]|uniref:DNA mismatch repair protein S5 domain-containing protein n=1 Tax=Clonostachys byssicola TaxID=160290 RepID=A0A9N9Y716_9HYPO|nr:unnamed protein product [Clonostachys byssicola]
MGIVELPSATARQLGASLDIVDPSALTKELLENSIDAGATHISILISPNTVDKILVRDNGSGILPADFDALGRRSHTSKLNTIDDLRKRGIKTLGFRGQALASANSIAALTITTRVCGDAVASQLRLKPGVGGVEGRGVTPAPVGTTVKAEFLFEKMPIRKRYAIKESQKTLLKIKELLRAYALARPDIKLSFKVLNDSKNGWDYAPSRTTTLQDAALQIFGRDLLNQCTYVERTRDFPNVEDELNVDEGVVMGLQALLPKPGPDLTQAKTKGRFFSVNSRPIASNRGISLRFISTVKTFLSEASGDHAATSRVSIPFIQLNIQCDPNRYDVNITPLKDELLFEEEEKIMRCFEALCRTTYQQSAQEARQPEDKSRQGVDFSAMLQGVGKHPTPESSPLGKDTSLSIDNKMNGQNESLKIGESLPHKEASNSDVQEGTGESSSYTPMRTGFGVNLDRTHSNGTDKVSSSDEVMIQIPLRPLLPNKCVSTKGKPKASTSLPGQALSMGDIHRYFKPTNQLDFEIATDDTATETNQSTAPPSPQPMSSERIGHRRLPLQPVPEGRLNILNNDNGDNLRLDHDNEAHSPPILSPIAGRRMGSRQRLNPMRHIEAVITVPVRDKVADWPPELEEVLQLPGGEDCIQMRLPEQLHRPGSNVKRVQACLDQEGSYLFLNRQITIWIIALELLLAFLFTILAPLGPPPLTHTTFQLQISIKQSKRSQASCYQALKPHWKGLVQQCQDR